MTNPVATLRLTSFGHALGCLYVLEGSSLGGRIVAGVIRSAIGEVPTTFFDGACRNHPAPWRAVSAALRRFEAYGTPGDVLVGARETFLAFGGHLAGLAPPA
jgi:heme oxygenase